MVKQIMEAFESTEYDAIPLLVQRALDEGVGATSILDDGLVAGIRKVGEQFRRGEVYLPDMMMAADAWQDGMNLLEPLLAAQEVKREPAGKVVIGTAKGDIHSLGKNIVVTMLKAVNFDVVDLGVDVPASKFADEAEKHKSDIIAVSALMTTTMPQQRDVIEHLEARGQRERYYLMVGGGCTTAEWAEEIKADAFGETAADAVALALAYMEKKGAKA